MKRFLVYISNGRGLGFLPILTGSILLSIILTLFAYTTFKDVLPNVPELKPILPITFKDNAIVDPIDQKKETSIKRGDIEYKIVLDTRTDELSEDDLKEPGLYLSRRYFYSIDVENKSLNRYSFEVGSAVFNESSLLKTLDNIYFYMSVSFFIAISLLLFIFLFFMSFFLMLTLSFFKVKDEISSGAKMRLNALAVLVAALFVVGYFLISGYLSRWLFAVYLALAVLIQYRLITAVRSEGLCIKNKD